jgi:N-acetylglucosamine kinase-like BadF-type ATPase
MFGDEGSGFWLALQAARRAILADDGLAAPTTLSEMLLDFFGRRDLPSLSKAFYGEEITRDRFAGFAAQVQRAAEDGEAAARAIVGEGGRFLAALVSSVARRLRFSPAELRVACVGGVFRGGPMREAFGSALRELQPDATIIETRFDPAVGALLLAYRAAGVEKSRELLTNLRQMPGADARRPGTRE